MNSKIHSYENNDIKVTWDQKRCIHAKECVHGLPSVFDIKNKPWINPDACNEYSELREVIERCPTGALHYEMKSSDVKEQPPAKNTISIQEDGPLYLYGELTMVDAEDAELMKDTRMALCRCGLSSNKPFCDNSHEDGDFRCGTSYNPERLELEPATEHGGELVVKLIANGPFVVQGNYELSGDGQSTGSSKKMSFCRCGHSENKPFCDGSHRQAGFEA